MIHKPDNELIVPSLELGIYVHYKSPTMRYEVVGVALDTETQEPMVIYKPLYASNVTYWVRPYDMFTSQVMVDGKHVPRFRKEAA